jgi:hypothetical protein
MMMQAASHPMQYGDKKNHHVINKYFTKDGTMVKNEGQIWNFHSWNDLWLHDVYGVKEGWCALDGTPPGVWISPQASVACASPGVPCTDPGVLV